MLIYNIFHKYNIEFYIHICYSFVLLAQSLMDPIWIALCKKVLQSNKSKDSAPALIGIYLWYGFQRNFVNIAFPGVLLLYDTLSQFRNTTTEKEVGSLDVDNEYMNV